MIIIHLTIAILISSFTCAASHNVSCPENEEYKNYGPPCPPSCQNLFGNLGCYSIKPTQGCFCKEGYIRAFPKGQCIPIKECRKIPICKRNEQLANCTDRCPRTCQNDGVRICRISADCMGTGCPPAPPPCWAECVCKEGYVKQTLHGDCVPEKKCPELCEENRMYQNCSTSCPGTCSEPSRPCNRLCGRGCICKEGYLLNSSYKCIKKEECPSENNDTAA